jgi:hypothetical protein
MARDFSSESNESGRNEVYETPFPGAGGKWQVSTAGGSAPRWRGDGLELYYLAADNKLMAVGISPKGASLEASSLGKLSSRRLRARSARVRAWPPKGEDRETNIVGHMTILIGPCRNNGAVVEAAGVEPSPLLLRVTRISP